MKKLEKTKRISIAILIIILLVFVVLLINENPKQLFKINTELALNKMLAEDYFIDLQEINGPEYVLIDIRNRFDYEKGHLENAINIPAPNLLNTNHIKFFEGIKEDKKTMVLYGNNPAEVNMPFMLLYQLGYAESKILMVDLSYTQNNLVTNSSKIEKNSLDINAFIKESQKKAILKPKPKKKIPKKIVPVKKKKKMPVEGGC